MNVPKRLIGSLVELHWKDPGSKRYMLRDMRRGKGALATWQEYGVVYDITEGVVIIAHSLGAEPGEPVEKPDEIYCSYIPEDLIEKIIVYKPETVPGN